METFNLWVKDRREYLLGVVSAQDTDVDRPKKKKQETDGFKKKTILHVKINSNL